MQTDALRRGALSPKTMEILQILKYHYRQQRDDGLDFSLGRIAQEHELEPKISIETINMYVAAGRTAELDRLIDESENPPPTQDLLPDDEFNHDLDGSSEDVLEFDDDW